MELGLARFGCAVANFGSSRVNTEAAALGRGLTIGLACPARPQPEPKSGRSAIRAIQRAARAETLTPIGGIASFVGCSSVVSIPRTAARRAHRPSPDPALEGRGIT